MSKLSFRARALDTTKPMPVLRAEDVPDLPDFAAINRAVPQMPTGMEKEEECEHHLQRAISAQQAFGRAVDHVIPTPEFSLVNDKEFDELYPANFKPSRAYIHIQLQSFEQDQPEYDMDSEDEEWLGQMKQHLNIDENKFEQMLECLEKSSGLQKVIDLAEAKSLLKGDESVVISVYDYWLNKKLKVGRSLLPTIKTEKRDGSSGNNPYIAFRRRTEKMQTRKNRKNDETSYEKMLKLKRDFSAVRDLMGLVKSREAFKLKEWKCAFDIYEKRYRLGDYNGQIYGEIMASRFKEQALAASNQAREKAPRISKNDENAQSRRKRDYKKRPKHENAVPHKALILEHGDYATSEDENVNDVIYQGGQINASEEIEDNPDGQFAFKRKKGCNYHAPLVERVSSWPWESPEEGGLGHRHFRFNLTSLSRPPIPLGLARRRVGRGGRIIFDRAQSQFIVDDHTDSENSENDWLHFRPVSPSTHEGEESMRICSFNAENFSDDDISDEPVSRLKDDTLLESHLYKYHENKLSSRINNSSVACSSQHSLNENAISSSSPPSNPSPSAATIKPITSQPKDGNSYLVDINVSRSYFDSIHADLEKDLTDDESSNNEGKHDFSDISGHLHGMNNNAPLCVEATWSAAALTHCT